MENRYDVKSMSLDIKLLVEALKDNRPSVIITPPLPADAMVYTVSLKDCRPGCIADKPQLDIILASKQFDEIEPGDVIPRLDVVGKYMPVGEVAKQEKFAQRDNTGFHPYLTPCCHSRHWHVVNTIRFPRGVIRCELCDKLHDYENLIGNKGEG